MTRPTILTSGPLLVVSTAFGAFHVVPAASRENVLATIYVDQEARRTVDRANAEAIAMLPKLVGALQLLVAFHDPDSLEDQETDAFLRAEHARVWENARELLEKVAL